RRSVDVAHLEGVVEQVVELPLASLVLDVERIVRPQRRVRRNPAFLGRPVLDQEVGPPPAVRRPPAVEKGNEGPAIDAGRRRRSGQLGQGRRKVDVQDRLLARPGGNGGGRGARRSAKARSCRGAGRSGWWGAWGARYRKKGRRPPTGVRATKSTARAARTSLW